MISLYVKHFRQFVFLNFKIKNLENIVWDLDGTMWQSMGMAEHVYSLYVKALAKYTNKNQAEVKKILQEHENEGSDWADTISLFSKKKKVDVLIEIDKKIKRESFIDKNKKLVKLIENSKKKGIRHHIVSNILRTNGMSCLTKLGFENPKDVFEEMFFIDDYNLAKPDLEFLKKVIEKSKIEPSKTLFVGDSIENDIIPAKKLRFKTCLIRNKSKKANLEYENVENLLELILIKLKK